MKAISFVCVGFLLLVASGGANNQGRSNALLSSLKVGQLIAVKELSGRYELLFNEEAPLGSKVVGIGDD